MINMRLLTVYILIATTIQLYRGEEAKINIAADKQTPPTKQQQHDHFAKNCTSRKQRNNQFPRELFTREQRRHGAIVIHILIAVYMIAAIVYICAEYFMASTLIISNILHLAPDVAGATIVALSTSSPELSISVIGVFVSKDEIGVGTIVGSALYNLLAITGFVALLSNRDLSLRKYPVVRDLTFYTISVLVLIWIIDDNNIYWYEGIMLVFIFIAYICTMLLNEQITRHLNDESSSNNISEMNEDSTASESASPSESSETAQNDKSPIANSQNYKSYNSNATTTIGINGSATPQQQEIDKKAKIDYGILGQCVKILMAPIVFILWLTVPECTIDSPESACESDSESESTEMLTGKKSCRWKDWRFLVTFVMSILWLAVFSWLLVWMITIIGDTFGINDTIMGLTIIAIGTSIPDTVTSVYAGRIGCDGNMALGNTFGSSIFDIVCCLGFPWFIQCMMDPTKPIPVQDLNTFYSSVLLLCPAVVLLVFFLASKWVLSKVGGVVMLVAYVIMMIVVCLIELNVLNISRCH